jgi:serine/threonine protein kinase
MGEVYRAKDTRLGRDVAIKALPETIVKDADRLHRFEQEARTIAALTHPNILAFTTSALTQRLQLKNNSATTRLESPRHISKPIKVNPT